MWIERSFDISIIKTYNINVCFSKYLNPIQTRVSASLVYRKVVYLEVFTAAYIKNKMDEKYKSNIGNACIEISRKM